MKTKTAIQLSDHFTYGRLLRFCFPSIVMMVFTSIYGVVDGLFISNFVGKTPFAAINLIMPFVMLFGGVGFMIGTGGSALVAKTLGEGDKERANRYFSMMILLTVLAGVLISAVGMIFMKPVALFLGADSEMLQDCVIYGRTSIAFTTAFMLQNTFQSFLITAERPKLGLVCTVAAGVTNMALDALFIIVFHWGVVGAALATGLSQCVGGVVPLCYFLSKKNTSLLRLVKTRLEAKPIIKACANGASEMVSNITSSVVAALYNFQLLKYAGQNGVAAYGVLMYAQFIFVAIFIGLSMGGAPIVGFHYGAQNIDELKNMLRKNTVLSGCLGISMAVVSFAFAPYLSAVFVGYDAELLAMTTAAFRITSLGFIFTGFNIFSSSFFTALNNGAVSAAISFLRTFVFKLSAVLLLPVLLGGVSGIWWAEVTAECAAFLLSIIFLFACRKKYRYF